VLLAARQHVVLAVVELEWVGQPQAQRLLVASLCVPGLIGFVLTGAYLVVQAGLQECNLELSAALAATVDRWQLESIWVGGFNMPPKIVAECSVFQQARMRVASTGHETFVSSNSSSEIGLPSFLGIC